jgi:DNA-binding MarR family transcriptional regulator
MMILEAHMPNEQIGFALARIGYLLKSLAWDTVGTLGINPTQAQILARLLSRGPSRATDLAAELGVTQPTISDALAALVRKEMLERAPDPKDGRAVRLHLTAQGRELAITVAAPSSVLTAALESLPGGDRDALQRGLVGLIRALQLARAIPVQRMCVTCAHFRPHAHSDAEAPHHCAFVDAAFADAALRIDCGDHEDAPEEDQDPLWARFSKVA